MFSIILVFLLEKLCFGTSKITVTAEDGSGVCDGTSLPGAGHIITDTAVVIIIFTENSDLKVSFLLRGLCFVKFVTLRATRRKILHCPRTQHWLQHA